MFGAESVPERKDRVSIVASRIVDLEVHSAILLVDVGKEIGIEQCVIKGGIKDRPLLLRSSFNFNTA